MIVVPLQDQASFIAKVERVLISTGIMHTQFKFKPGTVEENVLTIGPPAEIEPTLLQCRCNAPATQFNQWQIALASQKRRFDSCRKADS